MKQTKTLNIVVIILIVINVLLVSQMWMQGSGIKNRNTARLALEEELEFTASQKDAFKSLREKHFQNVQSLHRQSRNKRRELHRLWKGGGEEKAKEVSSEIGKINGQLELATFQHFQKVRELCTDIQKEKFDKIIDQVLRRGEGPPPGDSKRRPGPGGNKPPPRH